LIKELIGFALDWTLVLIKALFMIWFMTFDAIYEETVGSIGGYFIECEMKAIALCSDWSMAFSRGVLCLRQCWVVESFLRFVSHSLFSSLFSLFSVDAIYIYCSLHSLFWVQFRAQIMSESGEVVGNTNNNSSEDNNTTAVKESKNDSLKRNANEVNVGLFLLNCMLCYITSNAFTPMQCVRKPITISYHNNSSLRTPTLFWTQMKTKTRIKNKKLAAKEKTAPKTSPTTPTKPVIQTFYYYQFYVLYEYWGVWKGTKWEKCAFIAILSMNIWIDAIDNQVI